MYLVRLSSDQEKDPDLVNDAVDVIEMCHQISEQSVSVADLHDRNQTAKEALDKLIEEASRRVRTL